MGLRILLVEDNRVNQMVAIRVLEKMGHSVVVAENGREALALLPTQPFDLVLMDIQMPVIDVTDSHGESIRQTERTWNSVSPAHRRHDRPWRMKGDRERCYSMRGMDGYVSKPIHSRDLEEAIADVVGRRQDAGRPTIQEVPPEKSSPKIPIAWDRVQTLERLGGDETLLQEVLEIFVNSRSQPHGRAAPGGCAGGRGSLCENGPQFERRVGISGKPGH